MAGPLEILLLVAAIVGVGVVGGYVVWLDERRDP